MKDLTPDVPLGDALRMAIARRRPKPGLLHHSDQGRVYASSFYRQMLASSGMRQSMSRKGNCYDNACVESFFSSLKNELIHHRRYRRREEVRRDVFDYIEVFYNRQRMHQTLGYVSPMQYEQRQTGA